jgi:uncharacterized protein YecE (DUF72 family)
MVTTTDSPPRLPAEIRVGVAGWSYPDWEGIVYPRRKGRGFDPLAYLAGYFDTIELNNTFYRPPSAKMAASWARRVEHNPRFRFTAKVWQQITHARSFNQHHIDTFSHGVQPMADADRLSCVLLQYPWSFRNTPGSRERLKRSVDALAELRVAVELRHGSWGTADSWKLLREMGAAYCAIDQPPQRNGLPPLDVVTAEPAYFRLHGRNREAWFDSESGRDQRYDYLYDSTELDELADTMAKMAAQSGELVVIANNHYRGQAVTNALQLKVLLARWAGQGGAPSDTDASSRKASAASAPATLPALPAELCEAFPQLLDLGAPQGGAQTSLPLLGANSVHNEG